MQLELAAPSISMRLVGIEIVGVTAQTWVQGYSRNSTVGIARVGLTLHIHEVPEESDPGERNSVRHLSSSGPARCIAGIDVLAVVASLEMMHAVPVGWQKTGVVVVVSHATISGHLITDTSASSVPL